jgi:hypothetical protein
MLGGIVTITWRECYNKFNGVWIIFLICEEIYSPITWLAGKRVLYSQIMYYKTLSLYFRDITYTFLHMKKKSQNPLYTKGFGSFYLESEISGRGNFWASNHFLWVQN